MIHGVTDEGPGLTAGQYQPQRLTVYCFNSRILFMLCSSKLQREDAIRRELLLAEANCAARVKQISRYSLICKG